MATELVAEEGITDYGATQKEEELLVVGIPGAMLDRNHHHPTSSNKPSSRPLWKTKKFVVLGIIGMMMAAGVVVATLATLDTLLGDASSGPVPYTGPVPYSNRSRSYPRVTIVNDTPYDVSPLSRQNPSLQYTHVGYQLNIRSPYSLDDDWLTSSGVWPFCFSDRFDDPGIKAGQRWTASSSRGTCLVDKIVAVLTLPDGRGVLQCTNYEYKHDDSETGVTTGTEEETTGGTAKSIFYIRMGGGDGCCVRGSWQSPRCAPEQTYVHNPDYNYKT